MIPSACTVPYPTRCRHKVRAKDSRLFFPCCIARVLLSCMCWQGCCRALLCGGGPIQTGRVLLWRDTWQEAMLNEPLTLQYITRSVFLSVPCPAHLYVRWCAAAGELCWLAGPFQAPALASCVRGCLVWGWWWQCAAAGKCTIDQGSESGALVGLQFV